MRLHWSYLVAVALAAGVAVPAGAAEDKKPTGPTVVLQIKPIDELLGDAAYFMSEFGTLMGGAPPAGAEAPKPADPKAAQKQVEAAIAMFLGEDWRKALDTTLPLGLYANLVSPITDSTAVLLVPVADQKKLLKLLDNHGIKPDEKDGLYTFTPPGLPMPVHMRFGNGYAYITALKDDALAKDSLPKPATVLQGKTSHLINLTFHIDRVPKELRDQAVEQLEQFLMLATNQPGQSEFQKAMTLDSMKQVTEYLTLAAKEGKEVGVGIDFDRKTGEAALEFSIKGKPDSTLAKRIAKFEPTRTSKLGALVGADSAANIVYHFGNVSNTSGLTPEALEKGIGELMDKIPDEDIRKALQPLAKQLPKSVDAENMDFVLSLRGPNKAKQYNLVAGLHVKDGAGLEKAVVKAVNDLPEKFAKAIKFEQIKGAGGTVVHKLAPAGPVPTPPEFQKIFGDKAPALYLAFRPDAMMLAFGPDAEELLRKGYSAEAVEGPMFQAEVTTSRLLALIAAAGAEAQAKQIKAGLAGKPDKLRLLSVNMTGGAAIRLRYSVNLAIIKAIAVTRKEASATATPATPN